MIDVSQLRKLAGDLTGKGRKVSDEADRAVRKAGLDVVARAVPLCPVRNGDTQRSIGMDVLGRGTVQVGPQTSYAPFLEFGTSRMGPRPFMGPAAAAVEPGLEAALAQIGERL